MNFSGPLLLLIAPLAAAVITWLLCRWHRLSALAGIAAAWLLWAALVAVPLQPTAVEQSARLFAGDTFLIFGRALLLTEGVRQLAIFMFAGLILLFLLSIRFPQGRHFVPGALAALSPLTASLMMEQFAFSALLLLVGMAVLVPVIQAEQPGLTRAAIRFLLMAVLAVPLFLIAGWMLADTQMVQQAQLARLLIISIAILLAGFPFHIWVSPIFTDSPPLVSALLFGPVQLVLITFIFRIIWDYPWLASSALFLGFLRQSAAAAVVVGALLALTADQFSRLLSSLLLLDMGMLMLTLTVGPDRGWALALPLLVARFASLLIIAVSLSLLRRGRPLDRYRDFQGAGRRRPFTVALLAFGALSLIGLPLTAGFSSRYALLNSFQHQPGTLGLPILLISAMLCAAYGLFRSMTPLLLEGETDSTASGVNRVESRALPALLLLLGLGFAFFPHWWQPTVQRLAALFG